uniref:LAGLIDADG endonuclease n=1 Tax=Peronospora matthiolae TaxID=2874970 RepID=A0AAV1UQ49_9STRA
MKNNNDILTGENQNLWEFIARMKFARGELLDHYAIKSSGMMGQATAGWKNADLRTLNLIANMFSPVI